MKNKDKIIHNKAVRLVEGGIVEVDGHAVEAVIAPTDSYECDICEMDCICIKDEVRIMPAVCLECDWVGDHRYYLRFAKERGNKLNPNNHA